MKVYVVKNKNRRSFTYWDIYPDSDIRVEKDEEVWEATVSLVRKIPIKKTLKRKKKKR